MWYGALVTTSPHPGKGFDWLCPNGGFFVRALLRPFGLSLSKALRGRVRP
ncbi:MAG: hypothetical protein KXJ61_16925 [Hydrogenophaga sp.]|jgi:hypothetical protein|nr:hypothetical protein [Hydrogenophaga sp.]